MVVEGGDVLAKGFMSLRDMLRLIGRVTWRRLRLQESQSVKPGMNDSSGIL